MHFPQLRVRSAYSFQKAYGRMPELFEALKEKGCESAGLVDFNTFGHVRFEKESAKNKMQAMFGMEIPIKLSDDTDPMFKFKPSAWILASDTRLFYHATTRSVQNEGLFAEDFGELEGCIRFCGGAVDRLAIDQYDFIDVNPQSYLLASRQVAVHRRTGQPMVITSYNDMPKESHKSFAYAYKVRDAVAPRYILSPEEIWEHLQHVMTREEFDIAVKNTYLVAESLKGIQLKKAPIIHLAGDMVALAREGQEYRLKAGHISEWTQEYEDRFVEEIKQIQAKDFDSYFLVVADLVSYAKKHMLVGPARGSSAGSLVCYCLGITEVDPLPYKLLFQRFIDISRADLPDIDIDFEDTKRFMVFHYLQEKYGINNVSKMGNINTLKAASVMAEVGKKFNVPIDATQNVRNALIEHSSGDARYGKGLHDTFELTDTGINFKASYPAAARCMADLEVHPSHTGVHAAAILVCNNPISDYCTLNEEGVAQIDKPDSEYLNLLKIDALGLRTLGIINDAGVVTAEQLYGMKMDDPAVFKIINDDRVSGIFQFEGQAVRSVTRSVHIDAFGKIDNLTALARPGPLASGMAQKYIERAAGREPVEYEAPQLETYLADTYGVFLYQEQIMAVVKEIGQFDWVKTSAVRKAMSGRKGEEYFNQQGADFIKGAMSIGMEEEKASKIWKAMVTFGSWGFNKSHSVSYAIITYWTCWMKAYHPLEFAAACLRGAKSDEQTIALLRELDAEGIGYTAIDVEHSEMNWRAVDGKLVGGIMNAHGFGPVNSLRYIERRRAGILTEKEVNRLANAEVKFKDLHEMHTLFGWAYLNPSLIGVTSGTPIVDIVTAMAQKTSKRGHNDVICIVKLVKKVLGDENEGIRQKKREERGKGGWMKTLYHDAEKTKPILNEDGSIRQIKTYEMPEGSLTQFVDFMVVDDSTDSPIRWRVRPENFAKYGKPIAENDPKGSYYLVKGWKLPNIEMFIVKVIRRIYPNKTAVPDVVVEETPEIDIYAAEIDPETYEERMERESKEVPIWKVEDHDGREVPAETDTGGYL